MPQVVSIRLEIPDDLARLRLPGGVQHRLQQLLNRQVQGEPLTAEEHDEAEGLVNLAEFFALFRLRVERLACE